MARDRDPELLRFLAVEVALVVVAHLDEGAIVSRWLRVLIDPHGGAPLPGFNHAAFFDVLGGEIHRRAPNDERARALIADLLKPA